MKTNFFLLDFLFWSAAAGFRLGHLDYVVNTLGRRATPACRRAAWRGLKTAMRGLHAAALRWLNHLSSRP